MAKMNELSQVLDELVTCGEQLIRSANALRELFSVTAETQQSETDVQAQKAEQTVEAKTYTFTDLRKAFSAKSHAGFTDQVKTLITKYGADKLSAVKEEDYSALMADLEEIG